MTCVMNVEIGAYVLHALEEDEALALERHVAGCPQCQEELRELEFTASLLSLLSAEDLRQFEAAEPGPGGDQAVVPPASRRHRAFLPLVAAALVAAMSLAHSTTRHRRPTQPSSGPRIRPPTCGPRCRWPVRRTARACT